MAKGRKGSHYGRIRADSGQHQRVLLMGLLLGVLAFVPIAVRLFNLMVTNYGYYADLALRNQTRTTRVTGERGLIYDRNMNVLAANEGVENIYLDPHELKQSKADLKAISEKLGRLLNLDPQWIYEQGQDTTKRYKQIAARVKEDIAAQIRSYINENEISGIHLEPNTQRYYPYGTLASQVIGFTNASNTGSEG